MADLQAPQTKADERGALSGAFPDFFVLGAPKCGTTTLYNWLSGHQQVFMPGKELCFLSQDIFPTDKLSGHIPDLAAYSALFQAGVAEGKVTGDATPKYLHSDRALSEIRRLSRRPRLIVCVRDPVDLAISLHSQKVGEAWEKDFVFSDAWTRELNRTTPEQARSRPGDTNYVFWAHLGARLKRVFEIFDATDVLVLHLRDFRASPREIYVRVLDFLGLEDDEREGFDAANPRVGFASPGLNRLATRMARRAGPVLRPLYQLRGGKGLGVLTAINKVNALPDAYVSEVSAEFREQMYDFLAEDIALAESYLNGTRLTETSVLGN